MKGFGYVQFKREESARIAVNKCRSEEPLEMDGRVLGIDYEEGGAKGSYRMMNDKGGQDWVKQEKKKNKKRRIKK